MKIDKAFQLFVSFDRIVVEMQLRTAIYCFCINVISLSATIIEKVSGNRQLLWQVLLGIAGNYLRTGILSAEGGIKVPRP